MNRLTCLFISFFIFAILSGCSSTPATNPNVATATPKPYIFCTVILPENMSIISAYSGECLDDLAHGNGRITVEKTYPKSGEKFILTYEGTFQFGQLTGKGTETEQYGKHTFEGTFNKWKRWTGTVHFAKTDRQKEKFIYLKEGNVTTQPVDATLDPLYYTKASNSDCQVRPPEGKTVLIPYIGDCQNGLAHGRGKVTISTGGIGDSIMLFVDKITLSSSPKKEGITYEGSFRNGEFTGIGTEIFEDNMYWFEGTFLKWQHWTGKLHVQHLATDYFQGQPNKKFDVTQDSLYFVQDKNEVFVERKPTYANGYRPPEEREGILAIPILGGFLSAFVDGAPQAVSKIGDALQDVPKDTLARKTDELIARQKQREIEKEERKKQEKENRRKQSSLTEEQRSIAIQREISPPENGCASPSLSQGMCNQAGYCDDPRSGGQMQCSQLKPEQIAELKRRHVEVRGERVRWQQEDAARQAGLQSKLREDRERRDRIVEESKKENDRQHEEYAKHEQETQKNWAAYQRKQNEDRERFDEEQRAKRAKEVAQQNDDIERQRLANEVWEKERREAQARNDANRNTTSGGSSAPALPSAGNVPKQPSVVTNPTSQNTQSTNGQLTYTDVLTAKEMAWNNSLPHMYRATTQFSPAQIQEIKQDGRWNQWVIDTKKEVAHTTSPQPTPTVSPNSPEIPPSQSKSLTYADVLTPQEIAWMNSLPSGDATRTLPPSTIQRMKKEGRWDAYVAGTNNTYSNEGNIWLDFSKDVATGVVLNFTIIGGLDELYRAQTPLDYLIGVVDSIPGEKAAKESARFYLKTANDLASKKNFTAAKEALENARAKLAMIADDDKVIKGRIGEGGITEARRGVVYENPASLVRTRIDELNSLLSENTRRRITMGVAVVENNDGVRSVLISTSEPRGYLRPNVTLKPNEKIISGTGHAEEDIISYSNMNNYKVINIGATRPVCSSCQNEIESTGADISTPIKSK